MGDFHIESVASSDHSSLFDERCWETGYLDESPFSHSQYSFHAANPNILHSTQGHAVGSSNSNHTSEYSVAQGGAVTSQFMGYSTPMLGQPTPISPQPAHAMQSPPQCIANRDARVRSQRSRACPKPHKAEASTEPFQCKWKDCRSTQSFDRLNVLWRHIETQHLFPGAYKCHREGCVLVFFFLLFWFFLYLQDYLRD
ncbi:hypothetical protein VN97_g12503 [Penicillium thymicola]|uniref:C2H2-type domain-containing protein n=1 Tax=Penicillium thymicola TaxID=293382 RepID=A0AAI9T5E3_PENTH|nr:hypothetical protein VN97_g12503 [Penicillium thymicola]